MRDESETWYFNVAAYYQKVKDQGTILLTPFGPPAAVVASC